MSNKGYNDRAGGNGMVRELLTGNMAAAWGVRLANVDYVPAFPITPQTEIIETLSQWYAEGAMNGKFVTMDSEHSMVTAAGAASATGARVFTATSCQEVLDSILMAYRIAEDRLVLLPVLVNMDGYYLSFTREPVEIPSEERVR